MNEKKRILEMVQSGKLTVEQAEQLLEAMSQDEPENQQGPFRRRDHRGPFGRHRGRPDRFAIDDWKQVGHQVSQAVSQSLTEVKRAFEEQRDYWSMRSSATVSATTDLDLPPEIVQLSVETTNGKIHIMPWQENFVRIHVRGQAKTDNLATAQAALATAMQSSQSGDNFQLTIVHDAKDGIAGAYMDISVPATLKKIFVKSHNGGLQADSVTLSELRMETVNGGLNIYGVRTERLFMSSENGGIDVQNSIGSWTRNAYLNTKNGTILVNGMASDTQCVGTAKTAVGRIELPESFQVEFDDPNKRDVARFQSASGEVSENIQTRLLCETRNGSVRIRTH